MFSIQSKKIAAAFIASFIAVTSIFVVSCQKELSSGFTITENQPDLATKISSSVSGFVTDENDVAVQNATIQVGGISILTDKYGYFEVHNVQVVKNAAVLTVNKPGYFNGIKTFIASEGHSGFFRIKLLPKTTQGSFDAATGGTVTLTNGLSFTFPAGALVVASSSAPYTGQVNVAAQWLNPSATDINRTMPGDLRGLDSLGFMRVLTSYGMSATELTGASGELLQIATGKKATISFPIPSGANSSAPSTIPLWYFNETNGLWKQQGNAVKSGSTYVGEVSHFSWWNCDLPNATVPLTFNVIDAAGNPVSGAYVNIVPTSLNSWSHAGGYTDSTGHVGILVTADASYTLSIHGDCGSWSNPAYFQDFSVGTTAVDLGNITLAGPSVASVSGTVECSGAPLADAYVVLHRGYYTERYPVNADGTYSFTTTLCGTTTDVVFVAENLSTLQTGTPVQFTITTGNNTIPALQACTISAEQFVNYSVNGVSSSLLAPADSIYHGINTQGIPPYSSVYGYGGSAANYVSFGFDQNGIAAGTAQTLISFSSNGIPDSSTVISGTPVVNITEYGNVGEYIAGNFVCTLTNNIPPTATYAVTCSFRVRRRQ